MSLKVGKEKTKGTESCEWALNAVSRALYGLAPRCDTDEQLRCTRFSKRKSYSLTGCHSVT